MASSQCHTHTDTDIYKDANPCSSFKPLGYMVSVHCTVKGPAKLGYCGSSYDQARCRGSQCGIIAYYRDCYGYKEVIQCFIGFVI